MIAFPSKLVEQAVEQLNSLPGIGKKTALRLALHLLKRDENEVSSFCEKIYEMRRDIKYCQCCKNISDNDICDICSNPQRDKGIICVVQTVSDVMAIENTSQYNGVYHVLGGVISPLDGIGPQDLTIKDLIERIGKNDLKEIILALGTTIEGDTTMHFIYRQIKDLGIRVSILSRGVAIGDEIEYADEITLGRSIINRTIFTDN